MVRPCLRDLFLGPNSTASFKAPKWDFWTKSPSKKVAKPDFLHPRLLQRVFRPVMIQQVQRNFIQFEAGKKLSWLRTDWLGNKFAPGGLNCFEQSVGLVKIQLPQVGNNNSRFGLKIIHHAANHFVFLGFDSEEFFWPSQNGPILIAQPWVSRMRQCSTCYPPGNEKTYPTKRVPARKPSTQKYIGLGYVT